MSVTNAISGMVGIGGCESDEDDTYLVRRSFADLPTLGYSLYYGWWLPSSDVTTDAGSTIGVTRLRERFRWLCDLQEDAW